MYIWHKANSAEEEEEEEEDEGKEAEDPYCDRVFLFWSVCEKREDSLN